MIDRINRIGSIDNIESMDTIDRVKLEDRQYREDRQDRQDIYTYTDKWIRQEIHKYIGRNRQTNRLRNTLTDRQMVRQTDI